MPRHKRSELDIKIAKQIAFNLNKIINRKGLKQVDLSQMTGISPTTLSGYFNGSSAPAAGNVEKIAAALGVDKEEFDPRFSDRVMESIEKYSFIKRLPYYDSVSAGALATVEGHTNRNTKTLEIPSELLGKYSDCSGLFAMKVDGESMNKIIPNESYVIAKPNYSYKDGDIVIFSHDGEYALKRYLPHTIAGSLLFKAETTDKRIKDIVIPMSSDLETKIYGRVIWYSVTLP